jgi:histidinol dehydrogenase
VRGASFEDVLPRVAEIVADVRERGDAALLDWTERLDGERPELRVPADQLQAARLQPDELDALRALADAVAAFCEPQRPPDVALEAVQGVHSARRWVPLASVGSTCRAGGPAIRRRS